MMKLLSKALWMARVKKKGSHVYPRMQFAILP